MVDEALDRYLREQFARKYPKQALISFLITKGYAQDRIMASIQRVERGMVAAAGPLVGQNSQANATKRSSIPKRGIVIFFFLLVIALTGWGVSTGVIPLPIGGQKEDPTEIQAMLFVEEVRQITEAVAVTRTPQLLTFKIHPDYEKVCVVDRRKRPTIDEPSVRSSSAADARKTLFLVKKEQGLGFNRVSGFIVEGITAEKGVLCVSLAKGWISMRFLPGENDVVAWPQ